MAVAVHRNAIRASRQRLTLRQTCRSTAIRLSIALVQPSERRSSFGRPNRITVSISSSPFEDRSRDARSIMIEPTRQVAQNALGLFGGRAVPGLTQHLLDAGVQRRVKPLDDIASLVHLAALDQRKVTEGVTHGPAQDRRPAGKLQ